MTPLRTVEGVLAAIATLGLDDRRARAAANLEGVLRPDDLVPPEALAAVFRDAFAQRPSPELVTEIGMATRLGCFGVVDYLASSSTTIEGAMQALATHFSGIQRGARVTLASNERGHLMEIHSPFGSMREELTLAVTVGRFRRLVVGELELEEVSLRSSHSAPTRHAALFGCDVRLDAPVSSLRLSRANGELALTTRGSYAGVDARRGGRAAGLWRPGDPRRREDRAQPPSRPDRARKRERGVGRTNHGHLRAHPAPTARSGRTTRFRATLAMSRERRPRDRSTRSSIDCVSSRRVGRQAAS